MNFQNKVKDKLANCFFENSRLCSTEFRKYATLVCLVTQEAVSAYFEEKQVKSEDFEKSVLMLENQDNLSKQFKQIITVSYDDITITLKGIFIEDSPQISVNIHFVNKLTSQEDLVQFVHNFKNPANEQILSLDQNIESLHKLLKQELLEKNFKPSPPKKKSEPSRTLVAEPQPANRPRPGNTTPGIYPMPMPTPGGILPGRPMYPGLNPYIRYGRRCARNLTFRPD